MGAGNVSITRYVRILSDKKIVNILFCEKMKKEFKCSRSCKYIFDSLINERNRSFLIIFSKK